MTIEEKITDLISDLKEITLALSQEQSEIGHDVASQNMTEDLRIQRKELNANLLEICQESIDELNSFLHELTINNGNLIRVEEYESSVKDINKVIKAFITYARTVKKFI